MYSASADFWLHLLLATGVMDQPTSPQPRSGGQVGQGPWGSTCFLHREPGSDGVHGGAGSDRSVSLWESGLQLQEATLGRAQREHTGAEGHCPGVGGLPDRCQDQD